MKQTCPSTPPSASEPHPRTIPIQERRGHRDKDVAGSVGCEARPLMHGLADNPVPSLGQGKRTAARGYYGIYAGPSSHQPEKRTATRTEKARDRSKGWGASEVQRCKQVALLG